MYSQCSLLVDTSVFQNGGSYLCAVDDSNDHVLSVWDWQKEERLADVKVSPSPHACGRVTSPTGPTPSRLRGHLS